MAIEMKSSARNQRRELRMRTEFAADEPPLELTLKRLFGLMTTSLRLDPQSRTFRAEWASMLSEKSPLVIGFDDISNVEAKSQTVEGHTSNWIRLELQSGERENIPGGGTRETREAVDKIKAYIGWTPDDITTAPRAKQVRRNEVLFALAAVIVFLLLDNYSSIKNYYVLPDCDDSGIVERVTKILEATARPTYYLRDIQFVGSEQRATRCQATRAYDGREETFAYMIYWDRQNDVTVRVLPRP